MLWRMRIGPSLFSEARGLSQAFEIVKFEPPGREEEDVTGEEENEGKVMASRNEVNFNAKTPKGNELVARAKSWAKERNESFATALVYVAHENPQLAAEARTEALGRKTTVRRVGDYTVTDIEIDPATNLSRVVANMARERSAEKGIGFSQALSEVSKENPALIARYRAQVLGID